MAALLAGISCLIIPAPPCKYRRLLQNSRLAQIPLGPHARGIRVAVALVVAAIFVQTVERTAARAHGTTDRSPLPRSLAAAGDGAAGRADRGPRERPNHAVLH